MDRQEKHSEEEGEEERIETKWGKVSYCEVVFHNEKGRDLREIKTWFRKI